MPNLQESYEKVYRSLSRVELQKGAQDLDDLDLVDLFRPGEELWLGFYTDEGIRTALDRYGLLADLAAAGFEEVRIETKTDDPDEHLLRIWSERPLLDEDPLVELVVRRDVLRAENELVERVGSPVLPVLTIEWLQMQNPLADFSRQRPPLPGQHRPGLGVGEQVMTILYNTCKRLHLGALVTVPAYFHNAFFYSEVFEYFDPRTQGYFLALCRDLLPQTRASVGAASWALYWQMVRDTVAPGEVDWFHDCMIAPVSDELRAYFAQNSFQEDVQRALATHSFEIDTDRLTRRLSQKGIEPLDPARIATWIEEEG